MNNVFGGGNSLALLDRIKSLEKQIEETIGNIKIFHFEKNSQNGSIFIPYSELPGIDKNYKAAFIQDCYYMYFNKTYTLQRQDERIIVYPRSGYNVDDTTLYVFDIIFFL